MSSASDQGPIGRFLKKHKVQTVPTIECPVCGKQVPQNTINLHVEGCLNNPSDPHNATATTNTNPSMNTSKQPSVLSPPLPVALNQPSSKKPVSKSPNQITMLHKTPRTSLKLKKPSTFTSPLGASNSQVSNEELSKKCVYLESKLAIAVNFFELFEEHTTSGSSTNYKVECKKSLMKTFPVNYNVDELDTTSRSIFDDENNADNNETDSGECKMVQLEDSDEDDMNYYFQNLDEDDNICYCSSDLFSNHTVQNIKSKYWGEYGCGAMNCYSKKTNDDLEMSEQSEEACIISYVKSMKRALKLRERVQQVDREMLLTEKARHLAHQHSRIPLRAFPGVKRYVSEAIEQTRSDCQHKKVSVLDNSSSSSSSSSSFSSSSSSSSSASSSSFSSSSFSSSSSSSSSSSASSSSSIAKLHSPIPSSKSSEDGGIFTNDPSPNSPSTIPHPSLSKHSTRTNPSIENRSNDTADPLPPPQTVVVPPFFMPRQQKSKPGIVEPVSPTKLAIANLPPLPPVPGWVRIVADNGAKLRNGISMDDIVHPALATLAVNSCYQYTDAAYCYPKREHKNHLIPVIRLFITTKDDIQGWISLSGRKIDNTTPISEVLSSMCCPHCHKELCMLPEIDRLNHKCAKALPHGNVKQNILAQLKLKQPSTNLFTSRNTLPPPPPPPPPQQQNSQPSLQQQQQFLSSSSSSFEGDSCSDRKAESMLSAETRWKKLQDERLKGQKNYQPPQIEENRTSIVIAEDNEEWSQVDKILHVSPRGQQRYNKTLNQKKQTAAQQPNQKLNSQYHQPRPQQGHHVQHNLQAPQQKSNVTQATHSQSQQQPSHQISSICTNKPLLTAADRKMLAQAKKMEWKLKHQSQPPPPPQTAPATISHSQHQFFEHHQPQQQDQLQGKKIATAKYGERCPGCDVGFKSMGLLNENDQTSHVNDCMAGLVEGF